MYDEAHLTHDTATAAFKEEADGITVDGDGPSIDWDEVTVERVDDPPHAEAFDTKRFYKLPATVARPIDQQYSYGGDSVTLKKPREELKKAAWSLDNKPWTRGHPDTGMVKNVDDIRGFWKDPRYIDSTDDLDADLHVPVDDDEAKAFIQDNSDVSVGFYNRVVEPDAYDGIVGGSDSDDDSAEQSSAESSSSTDDSDLDGYQTDMYFDHIASVAVGRCPGEKGCGIGDTHGHISDALLSGTGITGKSEQQADTDMQASTDQPSGIHVVDGQWFAVGPDDHTKDSTDHPGDSMFPVDSCADIEDAWNLRGAGEDLTISEETLANRIIRAAEAKDCTDMPSTLQEQMDSATKNEADSDDDCGCGCGGKCGADDKTLETMQFDIDYEDLTADAILAKIGEEHEGVSDRLDELRQYEDKAEAANEAADELELDSAADLADSVGVLVERKDELEQRVDELEAPKREELAEYITERTDRFGDEEELAEMDLDELQDKKELVEDLTAQTSEKTANAGAETDSDPRRKSKYAVTPDEARKR